MYAHRETGHEAKLLGSQPGDDNLLVMSKRLAICEKIYLNPPIKHKDKLQMG